MFGGYDRRLREDPAAVELVRLYWAMPEDVRGKYLALVRAIRLAVPSDRAKAGLQLERAQQRHKFTLPPGLGLAENALHMIAYRPKSEPQTLRDCRQA